MLVNGYEVTIARRSSFTNGCYEVNHSEKTLVLSSIVYDNIKSINSNLNQREVGLYDEPQNAYESFLILMESFYDGSNHPDADAVIIDKYLGMLLSQEYAIKKDIPLSQKTIHADYDEFFNEDGTPKPKEEG